MKSELETSDIEAIAQRIVELIKSMLIGNDKHNFSDKWFNVKELSNYTGMSKQWIYNNKSKLPHTNINNKPLFRKSEVDHWLESFRVNPANKNVEVKTRAFNHQKRQVVTSL